MEQSPKNVGKPFALGTALTLINIIYSFSASIASVDVCAGDWIPVVITIVFSGLAFACFIIALVRAEGLAAKVVGTVMCVLLLLLSVLLWFIVHGLGWCDFLK